MNFSLEVGRQQLRNTHVKVLGLIFFIIIEFSDEIHRWADLHLDAKVILAFDDLVAAGDLGVELRLVQAVPRQAVHHVLVPTTLSHLRVELEAIKVQVPVGDVLHSVDLCM